MKKTIGMIYLLFQSIVYLYGQKKIADLDQYFSALIQNKQFNGVVLVAQNGYIVFERSFGKADFSNNITNTFNTAFPVASVSKTFTATAILQLAQSGKLKITDAVNVYLPWFPYPAITIRHLLSHTSGLPPYNAYFDSLRKKHPDTVFTNADFMNGVVNNPKPLIYQPGDRGNYDNINFLVLALMIEKVSGISYNRYIVQNIFHPAGMTHTYFKPLKLQYTQPVNPPFAFPYLYPYKYSDSIVKAKEVPFIEDYWSAYNFSGFGDYVSTVSDLLKYDKAYYDNRLLKKQIKNEAFQPVMLNNGKSSPANFGLGWQIDKDSSMGKLVFHNGNATGLSCIILRNISKHQTVIVFDNIHNNNSQELAFNLLKLLNGIQVTHPKKSIAAEYTKLLMSEGSKAARKRLLILKEDTVHYQLNENEMNDIGYDLMGGPNNPNPYHFPEKHKYAEAMEILKLNAELFPDSWNTHDSYGEILLLLGRKEEAIKEYKRSVELNPDNTGGIKVLQQLLK